MGGGGGGGGKEGVSELDQGRGKCNALLARSSSNIGRCCYLSKALLLVYL